MGSEVLSLPECTIERYTTRDEWLEARKRGIGASEVYEALTRPFAVWARHCGLDAAPPLGRRAAWGDRLQDGIVAGYAEETGRLVFPYRFVIWRSRRWPWLAASPDAEQESTGMPGRGGLEVKYPGGYRAHEWADGAPRRARTQLLVGMAIRGLEWGTVFGLLGGDDPRIHDEMLDPAFLPEVAEALCELWGRIERRDPPPPDGEQGTTEAIRRLFPRETAGKQVALPLEIAAASDDARGAADEARAWERAAREAKNRIALALGDAEEGRFPDGSGWRWSTVRVKGYTVEPRTERRLIYVAPDRRDKEAQ